MIASGVFSSKVSESSKAVGPAGSQGTMAEGTTLLPLFGTCLIHSLLFALAGRTLAFDIKHGTGSKKNAWQVMEVVLSAGDFSQGVLFALALIKSGRKSLEWAVCTMNIIHIYGGHFQTE